MEALGETLSRHGIFLSKILEDRGCVHHSDRNYVIHVVHLSGSYAIYTEENITGWFGGVKIKRSPRHFARGIDDAINYIETTIFKRDNKSAVAKRDLCIVVVIAGLLTAGYGIIRMKSQSSK